MLKKIISHISFGVRLFLSLFLCTILLLNIFTLISAKRIENGGLVRAGFAGAIVKSGSMEPAFFENDFLIIQSEKTYHVGDIITYVSPTGTFITHRIIQATESGFIAQGDANDTPDVEVDVQRILGRIILIVPGVGIIIRFLQMPTGALFTILFFACLIVIIRLTQSLEEDG